jgi:alkylation response protein AidB-like acyl-CoA dehydrogenase
MDFGLSDEQKLLQETLRRYLEENVPTTRVREIMQTETGHDPQVWQGLAELGITGLLVPEEEGGSGLGVLDAALAGEIFAYCAAPVPFLGAAVMAPFAFLEAGTPAQKSEWLPRIATGETCFGCAATETFSSRNGAGVRTEGGRLDGQSLFTVDAGAADAFLVAVGPNDLALVPRTAPGLAVEMLRTVDRTRRVGELAFDGVEPVEWVGGPGGAGRAVERMLDAGRVVVAADTLGSCDRAIKMSVEYAMQRRQFGRLIGSFQAVKHMCSEMVAEVEPARSLTWYAAYAMDALPEEAATAVALAKSHLAEVGTDVVRTATEVHGGIGFTEEFDLQLWFKRVELNRQLLGGPELMRERAARLQGWEVA